MEFTARNAAKYAVKATVHSIVQNRTADTIVDYTRFEEEDLTVRISSHLVGWYVADKVKPVTDSMVDKTADFIAKKRAERAAKKETAEEQ